ncbi:response regulator [Rhizobium laguerreae]|uniref:response regulator n=1 Tax=Rhizobium laguerreae TaxID=1076926 RepID=UPI001441452F|nr:response regulator [Rhizobium laguerreae]NKM67518.1 response regulator [Rhizobium laguerreae]
MRDTPVISIVDDDESSRIGTASLVRSLGFVAHAFSSARSFLHSEQLTETSCLISDVQMPNMSGIQLHDVLHARGYKMPIIFVTAYSDNNVRTQAFGRGAVCFLNKPFDGDRLSRCIEAALKNDGGDSD